MKEKGKETLHANNKINKKKLKKVTYDGAAKLSHSLGQVNWGWY